MRIRYPMTWTRRHFTASLATALVAGALGGNGAALAETAPAAKNTIVVVGDSLSAEYGVERGRGWVSLLAQKLEKEQPALKVHNAGISADTTAGGLGRLPSLLRRHQPAVVILELGANDALRGLPLSVTEQNLTRMIDLSKAAGAKVLLVGMQVPPNYGQKYTDEFRDLFPRLAKTQDVPLVPFLLKNVADAQNPADLFQSDRMHPNESAQPLLLDNVWPALSKLLPA
jgi:acyl-CoA thioesterase-1